MKQYPTLPLKKSNHGPKDNKLPSLRYVVSEKIIPVINTALMHIKIYHNSAVNCNKMTVDSFYRRTRVEGR